MGLFDKMLKNAVNGVLNDATREVRRDVNHSINNAINNAVSSAIGGIASQQQTQQQYNYVQIPESNTPDTPEPFGCDSTWLAIYGCTPQQVIAGLHLKNVVISNWRKGINATYNYQSRKVFVSPMISNYVLVVGVDDIVTNDTKLNNVAAKFGNMCAFGSQTVVGYCHWAKFVGGNLVRAYRFLGESGEVELNIGPLTTEEQQLGFDKLLAGSNDNWDEKKMADESHVLKIAKAWTIDTSFESFNSVTTTGYLCDI